MPDANEGEAAMLHPGREALMHVARVLEQNPRKDDDALSRATVCLARFRATLIEACADAARTPRDRERLSHLNAIVSVVMGMHFPLGAPPWAELEKAETWLRNLVAQSEG